MREYSREQIENQLHYIRLLSKHYTNRQAVCTEIINLKAILNLPKGTEHFLSDIHGENEAFNHVIRNGSGVIRRKIDDVFDNTLRKEDKSKLAMLIYYPEEVIEKTKVNEDQLSEWYKITLLRLILVCRAVSSKYTRSKVRKALPKDFEYIIEELLHEQEKETNKQDYYEGIIKAILEVNRADNFIIALCKLIQRLAVDHLHIIGDIYDRGPGATKVLDQLMELHSVDIQWGNHDILWMGAAAGSLACIANTIRISAKHGNLDTIEEDYGINLLPLATFAMEYYKNDSCKGFEISKRTTYKLSDKEKKLIKKIHKAISIIQFKLEGQIIKRNKDYNMNNRIMLENVNFDDKTVEIDNAIYDIIDVPFPTVSVNNPLQLTKEEIDLMNKLKISYTNNEKLQKHVDFLFSKGSMYKKYNSNLLYHGCIPTNENGEFTSLKIKDKKYSGKALIDKIERIIREEYFYTELKSQESLDLFWYLWCGPNSPLFGKKKMTTFERYFVTDKRISKEEKNSYYTFRDEEDYCNKILKEFGIYNKKSHIINGHVPVEVKNGESPIKANGKLLVIDGGLSKAYQSITGIAGYTLIFNSYGLLMVAHEAFESREKAIEDNHDIVSYYEVLEEKSKRIRVRDTDVGIQLEEEIKGLNMLLQAYRKGILKEK